MTTRTPTKRTGRGRPRDGMPENHVYVDDGCDIYPECLSCPLHRCRYDTAPGVARTELLVQQIVALAAAGQSAMAIGATVGRSVRSVYRLARAHGIRISGGKGADALGDGSGPHPRQNRGSGAGIGIQAQARGVESEAGR